MDRIFANLATVNRNEREGYAANNALLKVKDIETCTLAMWQLWFGAGLLLLNFSRYLQLHILNLAFAPGMTSDKFPALRQCKTLCVI